MTILNFLPLMKGRSRGVGDFQPPSCPLFHKEGDFGPGLQEEK
jgi:hypothetical protein